MKYVERFLNRFYKWSSKDLLYAILGILVSSLAINFFIVPNSLYNGGFLGLSQLIRTGIESAFDLHFTFDIAGLISLGFNIPLFIIAYRFISKTFFRRTLLCVVVQTFFLTIIPIPHEMILDDILTCVLIGGIIGGIGGGLTLSSAASGGGTDIIGVLISNRHRNFSVGRFNRAFNIVIYSICGILYGPSTMIYSIVYAVISSLVVDHTHKQNIISSALIFTKEKPDKVIAFIRDELKRDATYWEAIGGYDGSKSYITSAAMTKYEMQRLERHLNELSPNAFMIMGDGVGIDGNFQKKLTK